MARTSGQITDEQAEAEVDATAKQEHKARWYRRTVARMERRNEQKLGRRRRRTGANLSGAAALDRWQREAWAQLVRQAARLGHELETVQDRKRLIIALNNEQAYLAGVRMCTWATMNRKQRAAAIELALRDRSAA